MDRKSINCCQINLHKSQAASAILNERKDCIALITEPYSPRGLIKMLNKDTMQVLAMNGKHPLRAAVRVDKDLHPWLVPEYSDGDFCVVALKIESKLIYIGSLYLIFGHKF